MDRLYATVAETDHGDEETGNECRIRLCCDELTGAHEIEIRHRRGDGSWTTTVVSAKLRDDARAVAAALKLQNARISSEWGLEDFTRKLLEALPDRAVIKTRRPGWCDEARGFVTPTRRFGTARQKYAWHQGSTSGFGIVTGSLVDYQQGLLALGPQSSYLTIAVLIPLGAALLGYVEGRQRSKLLSESAVFHFAGETSSGKCTLARVAQSVGGDPGEYCDYRATARGVAEEAYRRNAFVAIFDEAEFEDLTEQQTFQKMKLISQAVTAGRSKAIARALNGTYPVLKWECFGISTGPETQSAIAGRLMRKRFGQAARFFDITVPPAAVGGIFDTVTMRSDDAGPSEASARAIQRVAATIGENHGVLFEAWIEHLLATDVSGRVVRLVDAFAKGVAGGEGGLHARIARKIGVLYAAAVLGIEAKLLPWSRDDVKDVVVRFYRKCLPDADAREAAVARTLADLHRSINDRRRFPRVERTRRGRPPLDLGDEAVGFIERSGNTARCYLLTEWLGKLGCPSATIGVHVAKMLAVDGEGAGPSEQVRLAGSASKPRAWRFDRAKLARAVEGRMTREE